MWVLHVSLFWWTAAAAGGCVVFVRAFVLPALTLCVFFYLSSLTIVRCAAYGDNGSHTHTHTHRYLSEMPSGGHLYFPDILHQTISSTVYKARLHGANKSNGSRDMCSAHGLTSRQLELLFFFIKECQNSVGTSSDDFLSFWCLFLQNEEKSQSEVSFNPPTALSILCFLCSLIFHVQSLDLLEHGGVFQVVSNYTCTCIVRDPVTGSSSSLNTCVHLYLCSFMHPLCFVS